MKQKQQHKSCKLVIWTKQHDLSPGQNDPRARKFATKGVAKDTNYRPLKLATGDYSTFPKYKCLGKYFGKSRDMVAIQNILIRETIRLYKLLKWRDERFKLSYNSFIKMLCAFKKPFAREPNYFLQQKFYTSYDLGGFESVTEEKKYEAYDVSDSGHSYHDYRDELED